MSISTLSALGCAHNGWAGSTECLCSCVVNKSTMFTVDSFGQSTESLAVAPVHAGEDLLDHRAQGLLRKKASEPVDVRGEQIF